MRITCPNCQATYQVGDSDIPEEGIEVECSACLNHWMQMPVVEEAPVPASAPVAAKPEPESAIEPEEIETSTDDAVVTPFPVPDALPESRPEPVAPEVKRPFFGVEGAEMPPKTPKPDLGFGAAPSSGWRVPTPPTGAFLKTDPLDEILAEIAPSAGGRKPEAEAEAEAPNPAGADEPDASEAEPAETDESVAAESVEEVEKVAEASAPSAPEPEEAAGFEAQIEAAEPEIADDEGLEAAAAEEIDSEATQEVESGTDAEDGGAIAEEASEEADTVDEIPAESLSTAVPEASGDNDANELEAEEAVEEAEIAAEGDEDAYGLDSEIEPVDEGEVEDDLVPASAPVAAAVHWSEVISKPSAPETEPVEVVPSAEIDAAQKGMEDLINTLSSGGATAERPQEAGGDISDANEMPEEEDEVFHPWDGEVAPEIIDSPEAVSEPEPEPEDLKEPESAEAGADEPVEEPAGDEEEEDFEWDEHPDPESEVEEEAPKEAHVEDEYLAAIERQKKGDLKPDLPQASNVIHADIPHAPPATMPTGHAHRKADTPHKPTPVQSPEEVEAAIRAQMSTMKKPEPEPEAEEEDSAAMPSLFGRKKKAKKPEVKQAPAPRAKPSNPLKDALMEKEETEKPPRKGKKAGFYFVLFLFALALMAYILGDVISDIYPPAKPYLDTFSGLVDKLRAFTQQLIARVTSGG